MIAATRAFSLISIVPMICLVLWPHGGAMAADEVIDFDHDETSFPLDFIHARVNCDACHLQSVFSGTPSRCHECHSRSGRIQATAPSPRHIRTTNDCEFCHQAGVWEVVIKVDHFAVTGSCQSCHNGVIATGKNTGHIQSSNECDDCHRTLTWLDAVFDHSEITASCISCHNGVAATGKNPQHIQSTDICEDCHRTISWLPVARVDHNSVFGACSSCHNGVIAEGKDADHEVTTEECDVCHTTVSWIPATSPRPQGRASIPGSQQMGYRCMSCRQHQLAEFADPAAKSHSPEAQPGFHLAERNF